MKCPPDSSIWIGKFCDNLHAKNSVVKFWTSSYNCNINMFRNFVSAGEPIYGNFGPRFSLHSEICYSVTNFTETWNRSRFQNPSIEYQRYEHEFNVLHRVNSE